MSLDELKNARWSALETGVEHISLRDGKAKAGDSIHFTSKGFLGSNITMPEDVYNEVHPILTQNLIPILRNKLPKSAHGYLKINLYQLINGDTLTAVVYLADDIDSKEVNNYIKTFLSTNGVFNARYISKETAKTKYLENGNDDWTGILETNPLPASIEIKIDEKIISRDKFETFRSSITGGMLWVREVILVNSLFQTSRDNYYIIEYSRQ
jgi:hypothetical protein